MSHYQEEPPPAWLQDLIDNEDNEPLAYPEGVLDKMSMKQLKQECTKQIGRADNASFDYPAYDDAVHKHTYLLIEIDRRQCAGRLR
jgi:hypothetical protein